MSLCMECWYAELFVELECGNPECPKRGWIGDAESRMCGGAHFAPNEAGRLRAEVSELKGKLKESRRLHRKACRREAALRERLAEGRAEWPDPRQEEAMDATLEAARMVSSSMAQVQDPLAKFAKLHSGMAAIYLLAYEAGRVQGMTGGEDVG